MENIYKSFAKEWGIRTFLVSARKVPKEAAIGEALSVALPRAKDALSYVPLPSRTW